MFRSPTVLLAALLTLLALAPLAACGNAGDGASPTPVSGPLVTVDRIVYVGDDGNVYTIGGDGTGRRQHTLVETGPVASLTASGLAQTRSSYYAWPTWSPNGTRLVVSRVIDEDTARDGVDLRVLDLETETETVVYVHPPGDVGFVAQDAPHYAHWHPDGTQIGFLASGPAGLTFYSASAGPEATLEEVTSGVPLYFAWSPTGDGAVLHVASQLYVAEFAKESSLKGLQLTKGVFRAPSFSHDGNDIAFVDAVSQTAVALYTAGADGSSPAPLVNVEGQAAFLWSPNARSIAYADAPDPASALFTRLTVVDADSGDQSVVTTDPTIAFSWSPDGSRIAYVSVDDDERWLVWKVARADGSASREIGRFFPSQETFIALTHFDQYAQSHSHWSPDSTRLVFSGRLPEPDGSLPATDSVIVLDADGVAEPRHIAEGTAASWSWR